MASSEKNLSEDPLSDIPALDDFKIGVVVSDWNSKVTDALRDGCLDLLRAKGVSEDNLHVIQVPGSYELPLGARLLDDKHNLDAVICLGCVVKGETRHDEYINQSVSNAIMQLGVMKSKPFLFGLLTCEDMQQAIDRSGGKHGNKGIECAVTAIQMVLLRKKLRQPGHKIGFS